MADLERVIKAIEICYTLGHNCTECPLFSEDDCNDKLMHDALALLKAQDVPETNVGKWISVKERMPEKSGQYLCWFGANKVVIGPAIETYVDEWKAFGRLESLEKYPNITHWMPLPEPPKEET